MKLKIRTEFSEDGIFYHIDGNKGERFAVTRNENYALLTAAVPDILEVLKKAVGLPLEVQEIMKSNGIVINDFGDKWQKFAFTLYTMIVEMATESEDLIARAGAK